MEQNKNSTPLPGAKLKVRSKAVTAWPDPCNLPSCPLSPGQLFWCCTRSDLLAFAHTSPSTWDALGPQQLFLRFETQLQCHLLVEPYSPQALLCVPSAVCLTADSLHCLNALFTYQSSALGSELCWESPRAGTMFCSFPRHNLV